MQRFEINMLRFPATAPVSAYAFTSRVGTDDLVYQRGGGRGYICAPGVAPDPGERVYIHAGPDAFLDHAAEAVLDIASPRRAGDGSLGLVLAWKTSGQEEFLSQCVSSSPSGVPPLIAALIGEDLGLDDHIKILFSPGLLRIVERRAGVDTELWALTLDALHRRIALRAAYVDGEVTLWWNPLGVRTFEERPIARVASLNDGLGRVGFLAGADGRILEFVAEYRTGTTSQPVLIRDITEAAITLEPVRLHIGGDISRPAMLTGLQVEHVDDTHMPERQERVSRVFLRDARMLLRPGHRYRARGWLRTCDDQTITLTSRPFELEGDQEDLSLRDCLGRLVSPLPADEEIVGENGPETRSDIQILIWPESLKAAGIIRTGAAPARADAVDGMDVTRRGVQKSSLVPRTFTFSLELTDPTRKEYIRFRGESRARVLPFLWTHPLTSETIVCRFADVVGGFKGREAAVYQEDLTLVEEPRCLAEPSIGPVSPGYSVPLEHVAPGTGACCLADHSCIVTTAADCARRGGRYAGDGKRCAEVDCGDDGGGPPPPPFDCETDCGDGCNGANTGDVCFMCPPTSGDGAALCGCQFRDLGYCQLACDGASACGSGNHGATLKATYCCYETGKVLLSSDTGGLSVRAWCCSHSYACSGTNLSVGTAPNQTCHTSEECCASIN